MVMKGSCLDGQEDAREASKPCRCLVHCCTVVHLVSPTCSWFASWRSPSKFWALSIHLEYRFSIWHSSITCEVFLNQFPGKKKKVGKDTGRNVSIFSPFWEFLWIWLAHLDSLRASSHGLVVSSQDASLSNNNAVLLSKNPHHWFNRRGYH